MTDSAIREEMRQGDYDVRFDWGPHGLRALAPLVDVVVIVDVMSFSTSVDVALGRGAVILPYRWHNGTEHEFARSRGAAVAGDRRGSGPSLRPSSLTRLDAGTRLVLPSPNGSALTFGAAEAGAETVAVACLRNADAIGRWLRAHGGSVGVIAAGERWRGATGPLRTALEDLLGAGAVIAAMGVVGSVRASPEAQAAAAVFEDAASDLMSRLETCGSGRELIADGFAADVALAGSRGSSDLVPLLRGEEILPAG